MHHSPPSLGCLKGSTSTDQRRSLQASTQQNQSPNEWKSKAKGDLKIVKLPCKTRSGRAVRLLRGTETKNLYHIFWSQSSPYCHYFCIYVNIINVCINFIFGQEASKNASANLVWFQWRKTQKKLKSWPSMIVYFFKMSGYYVI